MTHDAATASIAALTSLVDRAMLSDRVALRRRLQGLERALRDGKCDPRALEAATEAVRQSVGLAESRRASLPPIAHPPELPLSQRRDEIAAAIEAHQVVVVCGETGSGKTTQLPKICLALGRGVAGMIGHTQPRRIAARAVAARIAQELGSPALVGFKVRFADHIRDTTLVKVMTDGILLAEIQHDRLLRQYDTLIIDEAHERSLNIDFLIGCLRQLLPRRPELKLIITSATIDPQRFAAHFGAAPVISVSGRTYPVEVRHRPIDVDDREEEALAVPDAIAAAIDELWREAPGDTLVFLPGEREIRETAEVLRKHHPHGADILPLYARLSAEEQMRVFRPHGTRRIVLATNVAETSLTVPGIRYVVDPGLARISRYSARQKVQRLPIEPVSQASAEQRKGRCGRVSDGVCVRLYSEEDFASRPAFTDPEILRTNLASVILQMKALELGEIESFGFIDPPDPRLVRDGYQTLYELGALDEGNRLTGLGRVLARLPIDPRIGRMILAAERGHCLREVLIIAAALSIQDPRERPMDKAQAADDSHREFREGSSDFLALLNLWRFFEEQSRHLSQNKLRHLCRERFLSFVRLREWHDVHSQLRELIGQMGWHVNPEPATYEQVHRALLTGLLANVGCKTETSEYAGLRQRRFHLFPGSSQFHRRPPWVVAAELVETTRLYARTVAAIQPEWIEDLAAHLVRRSYAEPHWDQRGGRVVAYEKVLLHGLAIIPKRSVHFGPIDPRTSRQIFIRSALVEGDYESDAPFLRHNRALVREIELLEAKLRRRDIMVDHATQFAFYDARLPADVWSRQTFDRWRRDAERADRRLLFMAPQDLMARHAGERDAAQFPDVLDLDGATLPLTYRFDPGHPADGVTVTVPLTQLQRLEERRVRWLVPGLLEDKVIELIRALPRPLRTKLVPAPDAARAAIARLRFADGDLAEQLSKQLALLAGAAVPATELREDALPDFLRMHIVVVDEAGRRVGAGRDLAALRAQLSDRIRGSLEEITDSPFVRENVRAWDFPDLPPRLELRRHGVTFVAYPTLEDRGDAAALRLSASAEEAVRALRGGVRRLVAIELNNAIDYQLRRLPTLHAMTLHYATLGAARRLRNELSAAIAEHLMGADHGPIRTRQQFERLLDGAWDRVAASAASVGATAAELFALYHDLQRRLEAAAPPLLQPSIDDMKQQLRAVVPADVLTATPRDWVAHVPRLLRGMQRRLEKLQNAGLERDRKAHAQFQPLLARWSDLARTLPAPRSHPVFWLLQELRVSLFAQELRTSVPVSVERVARSLEEALQRG